MKRGGDLKHFPVFEKILSIGYEFETHELAKLSLARDGKTMVNTNLNMRYIDMSNPPYTITKLDNHSYNLKSLKKRAKTEVSEFVNITFEEDDNIKMHVINDMGHSDFQDVLSEACKPHENHVSKNKMYIYKTPAEKYNIEFLMAEENSACDIFSGVEWLVTYYKPKQSKKIILDTFIDASMKLYNHLQSTQPIAGNLYYTHKRVDDKLGELENRPLYRLPDTNLHYLPTYDTDDPISTKGILDVMVVPQMTFRCSILDALDVMKRIIKDVDREHSKIKEIERTVLALIEGYNASASPEWQIPIADDVGKKVLGYLFMIYYKLYAYIDFFSKLDDKEGDYLKNYLTFSARNSNFEYYEMIKELLENYYAENASSDIQEKIIEIIMAIVDQPQVLKKLFVRDKGAFDTILTVDDEGYGDPAISYISYFKFFEEPSEEAFERETFDWFAFKKYEFTTTFPIENDTILIENRLFVHELFRLIKRYNIPGIKHETNSISVRNLKRLQSYLTGTSAMEDLKLTPREELKGRAPRGKSRKILLTKRGGSSAKTRRTR